MDALFSPLGGVHCTYFLGFTVFWFGVFAITLALAVFGTFKGSSKMELALALAAPLLSYYVHRILFSVCTAALPR